jgi:ribosomal protein L11 methyltransferase
MSGSLGWVALRVEVAAALADAVANFLFEQGANGVVTADRDVDAPEPSDRTRLEAALPAGDEERLVASLARYLASLAELEPAARDATVTLAPVPPVDWTEIARRHHRPVAVGRRLLVAPPWDVPAAPGREVLVIEPGMAFGTGQHATTRGCLEAIEEAVAAGTVDSALDVGTGSGLLALALARLGVPRVVALDLDADVLPIARANLRANGAPHVSLLVGTLRAVRSVFALVVANLLADTIVAEAAALADAVATGGRLIVSGLLVDQVGDVAAAFPGWTVAEERGDEAWRTLTLLRRTSAPAAAALP